MEASSFKLIVKYNGFIFVVKLITVYSSFTQSLGFAANKMATAGKGVFRFPVVLLSNRRFESSNEDTELPGYLS